MTERRPAEVFHPGEYLLDELNERGWSQTEFAEIIRRPVRLVNEIVNKRRGISTETAQEIAAALGTSAEVWINLDTSYNLWRSERDLSAIKQHAKIRSKYPVRDMVLRGWLEESENINVLESQVLSYFEIDTLDETPKLAFGAAARRTGAETEEINSVQLAWLYRVKHIASAMQVPKYTPTKLKEGMKKLEALRSVPEEIRHAPEILEQCGVRFVVVEPMPSSKIDGVCFWLANDAPVIGLSLRFDRIDNFWFVLRHEIEHVLRADGKSSAVLDSDIFTSQDDENLTEQERAANSAAAEFCVPQKEFNHFIARHDPYFSRKHLLGFAKKHQVHPGIVVGQLQHKTQRYELFRNTLVSIRDFVTPVAMTDGYGNELPVTI